MRHRAPAVLVALAGLALIAGSSSPARADEAAIVERLAAWFATEDEAARSGHVAAILADEAWDPASLPTWLRRAHRPEGLRPGVLAVELTVNGRERRRVHLRLPRDFRPDRPWPLLIALHPSGGDGPSFITFVENVLGGQVERYVIAAPSRYRRTSLDLPGPHSTEMADTIRGLKMLLPVDDDRVYAFGYSLGGYACWAYATVHSDRLAAAVPVASTYTLPSDVPGLWEAFLPNLRGLPVLHVWGGRDRLNVPGFGGRASPTTMAQLNVRLDRTLDDLDLDVTSHRLPTAGHGGVRPPRGAVLRFLRRERGPVPTRVRRTFRELHQSATAWAEGTAWRGDRWDDELHHRVTQRGFDDPAAEAAAVLGRLGHLEGTRDGQRFELATRHLAAVTVWIGDGMIDFAEPVTVTVNGATVFTGRVERDLATCLAEVERTGDRTRLRWAAVRVEVPEPAAVPAAAPPAADG